MKKDEIASFPTASFLFTCFYHHEIGKLSDAQPTCSHFQSTFVRLTEIYMRTARGEKGREIKKERNEKLLLTSSTI